MAADTIFALSSGMPPAAIAIIRISGPNAFDAVRALAGRLPAPRHASLASLTARDGSELDRGLVLTFPAPDSATGEDLAELHLHGGRAVVRAVEAELGSMAGLRAAEAGEFTRRAFANGRIDLNEAEGLADLLTAETEWQRRAAVGMSSGAFSAQIEAWRTELLSLSALTEAELDFSDEGDVDISDNHLISKGCMKLHGVMMSILAMPAAEKLRDGLRIVLGGPPNSGKSTLLNALVAREAAIVSDIAGTTRDMIEVPIALDGIPLLFVDTAGLRDSTDDKIEAIGIDRTRNAMAGADIILWLGAEGEGPEHPELIEVEAMADDPAHQAKSENALAVSARTWEGMSPLIAEIVRRAKPLLPPPDGFAVNARQRRLLEQTASELNEAGASQDWIIVGEHLRQARLALDALTGRADTENMLDALFGRFCVGK